MWWAIGLLAGCNLVISRDEYPEAYARAWCNAMEDCYEADFYGIYDDKKECREDVAANVAEIAEGLDLLGDYDEEHARDCIRRMNSATCEEYAEDASFQECEGVWHN